MCAAARVGCTVLWYRQWEVFRCIVICVCHPCCMPLVGSVTDRSTRTQHRSERLSAKPEHEWKYTGLAGGKLIGRDWQHLTEKTLPWAHTFDWRLLAPWDCLSWRKRKWVLEFYRWRIRVQEVNGCGRPVSVGVCCCVDFSARASWNMRCHATVCSGIQSGDLDWDRLGEVCSLAVMWLPVGWSKVKFAACIKYVNKNARFQREQIINISDLRL